MQFFPILFVILASAVVMIMSFNRLKQTKAANAEFLAQHPEAAKVYLTAKEALIKSNRGFNQCLLPVFA